MIELTCIALVLGLSAVAVGGVYIDEAEQKIKAEEKVKSE